VTQSRLSTVASIQHSPPQLAGPPPVRFVCFATPDVKGSRTRGALSMIDGK
jgi:hypothetical protein